MVQQRAQGEQPGRSFHFLGAFGSFLGLLVRNAFLGALSVGLLGFGFEAFE